MVKNPLNFFENLEKHRAIQSQTHSAIINQDEITDQDKIYKQIFSFYQSLFSRESSVSSRHKRGVFR